MNISSNNLGSNPEDFAKPTRPIQQPQSAFGAEDKTNASDMSINSSLQNNSNLNMTAKPEQPNASSILNIPAEALSNFNSAQPQRPPQQQLVQQQDDEDDDVDLSTFANIGKKKKK